MTNLHAFPLIARHGHRPLLGRARRVVLSSATVDASTKAQLQAWQASLAPNGVSMGLALDQVVAFARNHGFPYGIHKDAKPISRKSKSSTKHSNGLE